MFVRTIYFKEEVNFLKGFVIFQLLDSSKVLTLRLQSYSLIARLPLKYRNQLSDLPGIISQNIALAITIKILFVILATLGLITLIMSVGIGDLGLTLLVI